jgi:hypothetical protein
MNIVYTTKDGFLVTVVPAPEYLKTNTIEDCAKLSIPVGTTYKYVDPKTFPKDVDFRDAWQMDGDSIVVSFSKAQEVKKKQLRIDRVPLLAALDVQFQRALESKANTTAIVNEKKRLRDITSLVDDASTLDELRSIVC